MCILWPNKESNLILIITSSQSPVPSSPGLDPLQKMQSKPSCAGHLHIEVLAFWSFKENSKTFDGKTCLSCNIDHLRSFIIEWEKDSWSCVNILHRQSFAKVCHIPDGVLPVTLTCKPSGEELVGGTTEDDTRRLRPTVSIPLLGKRKGDKKAQTRKRSWSPPIHVYQFTTKQFHMHLFTVVYWRALHHYETYWLVHDMWCQSKKMLCKQSVVDLILQVPALK